MTADTITRLALAGLALVLGAAPAARAQDGAAAVPGNRYAVVNQTGAPLSCKYRVNSTASGGGGSSWQTAPPIAAGSEFTRTVQGPGESVSLDCNDGAGGGSVTVQPGRRYSAAKTDDGKVVVTRVRT